MPTKRSAAVMLAASIMFISASAVFCAEKPMEINTDKTAAHIGVFDIPVYIKPVAGVNLFKTDSGCADKTKKISLEASQLRVPYETLVDEFNGNNLKKAGMEIKLRSEFIWNGSRAMLIKAFQKDNNAVMGKWILVIDRDSETWMINGLYDSKNQARGEAVLKMLKSVCWDKGNCEPQQTSPLLNINADGTPFRLATIQQDAIVYTKDGELPTKSADGAIFVISRSPCRQLMPNKRIDFAKERFKLIDKGESLDIVSEREVSIDGLFGVELVAYAEDAQKCLIYQTMLFDRNDSHVMVGIAHGDAVNNLELFHKLTESYRRESI